MPSMPPRFRVLESVELEDVIPTLLVVATTVES